MWADFGTVCHWITMEKLGCAPQDVPTDAQLASARTLEKSRNDAIYDARVERCTDLAITGLEKELGKLPPGVRWVSEYPTHDATLLPTRKSRKGVVTGYGGSIDLITSDRSVIVDLKFVSKPVMKLKIEYLWQLGSYAMLTGIMKTFIIWIATDGKNYYHLTIDWSLPYFNDLMQRMRKFIERTGHANFAAHAFPIEGEHCEYCERNPGSRSYNPTLPNRCPLKAVPSPQIGIDAVSQQGDLSWLDDMQSLAAVPAATKPLF